MATKKEFILDVVDQLQANIRRVLAGNGVPKAVITAIQDRPDVMAKLASFLVTTKKATLGANGLKKSNILRLAGYRNFQQFQQKSPEDIVSFMETLPEEDVAKWQNNENVVVILMLPEHKTSRKDAYHYDADLDTHVAKIVKGKSVMLTYETAVKKQYKVPGGVYLTIMFGDSAIRPKEEKIAFTRSKKNNLVVARKERVASVRARLTKKASREIKSLNRANALLKLDAQQYAGRAQQQATLRAQYGDDVMYGIGAREMQASHWNANRAGFEAGLSDLDRQIYSKASKLWARGSKSAALAIARTASNPQNMVLALKGSMEAPGLSARQQQLKAELRALNSENRTMMSLLRSLGEGGRKAGSLKSRITANKRKIANLRGRLGTVRNPNAIGSTDYVALLGEVNQKIANNVAAGASIRAALKDAISGLPAPQLVKQQIAQQAVQQIAVGMPPQAAVQQAIQQVASARKAAIKDMKQQYGSEMLDVTADGNFSMQDLLASL